MKKTQKGDSLPPDAAASHVISRRILLCPLFGILMAFQDYIWAKGFSNQMGWFGKF